MSEIPSELRYTRQHEWVRRMDDGHFEIGITEHAQSELGDMVFVELPEVGSTVSAGDECAVVESVKAASDIYAPLTGEVAEVNTDLDDNPEIINRSPFADGWIYRLRADNEDDWNELMDADAYRELLESE